MKTPTILRDKASVRTSLVHGRDFVIIRQATQHHEVGKLRLLMKKVNKMQEHMETLRNKRKC
jgi:hypothetical protein